MLTVKDILNELVNGIESLEIIAEVGEQLPEVYKRALLYSISFKCPVYFIFNDKDLKYCVNATVLVHTLIAELDNKHSLL